jgi:alkylation response protein AidB-like acyl-CoA dehydrogenase
VAALSISGSVDLIDPATRAAALASLPRPRVLATAEHAAGTKRRAGLITAAYLVGIARRMLDLAVEYAGDRVAFGHPIGSFQAIKHRLATVAMDTEAADAQVAYASVSVAQEKGEIDLDVEAAKVLALKAALDACGATIQTHGALGVTWEFDGHLFLSRARMLEHVPAGPRLSLERLVRGHVEVAQ